MKTSNFFAHYTLAAFCSLTNAAPTSSSSIQWSQCPEPFAPGVECAQLKVPLNWDKPKGDKIILGLTRLPAKNPKKRVGNLFYNPGGPGAITSQYLNFQAMGVDIFGWSLVEQFDIIGVDPRGMGLSTRVKCDPEKWNERVTAFPKSTEEFDKLVARNKAAWSSCQKLTGPLLGHVDTTSFARDIEAVRVALGDQKLNWFGASYGTQVGAAYAELFPNNFRTMALDAVVDHSQSATSSWVTESTAYESVLKRFFSWCDESTDCLLHGQNVTSLFVDLVEQADKQPIPAPGCSQSGGCRLTVTGEDILFNAQGMILFKPQIQISGGWNTLAFALQEASSGNATLLSTKIATDEEDDLYGGATVLCLDWMHPASKLADIKYMNEIAGYWAPITKGASQFYGGQTSCIGFPLPLANPQHNANIKNREPILMTNALYDPSTSVVWAEGLRHQIENEVLVLRDGDGHTSYNLNGTTTQIIEAYLVNKTLPAQNTVVDS